MCRSAAAGASCLGQNVGAPGLSSVGLSGGGILSHTSSTSRGVARVVLRETCQHTILRHEQLGPGL